MKAPEPWTVGEGVGFWEWLALTLGLKVPPEVVETEELHQEGLVDESLCPHHEGSLRTIHGRRYCMACGAQYQ